MNDFIPYGRQSISEQDIRAVVEVLKSDFLTQGLTVPKFEKKVCEFTGAKHGIAVNSATSALHLACLVLDVQKGDLVWTSPISFVASANCALYCGADIDFVDIDEETLNMSTIKLEKKLIESQAAGRLPKVVIPVHMAGLSCDMEKIHQLSLQFGFKIIEDASHAIGATYRGHHVGSCAFSHITVFSFHPVKIITSGEGGMVLCNSVSLADKVRLLRSHGITREAQEMINLNDHGPWYYEQVDLGFNYRMTDIQAALGLSQMDRLSSFVNSRNKLALEYKKLLEALPVRTQILTSGCTSSYHLFIIKVPAEDRLRLYNFLKERNIGVNVHYLPIHLQPYYQKRGFGRGDFQVAENVYSEIITLPLFPDISNENINFIAMQLRDFYAS